MHIECVFTEIYLLKNKYLAKIIAYKKIKAFSPMQKTYNIGSTKFSFPFNIELLFHYVVLKCLLQGSQMQLFALSQTFFNSNWILGMPYSCILSRYTTQMQMLEDMKLLQSLLHMFLPKHFCIGFNWLTSFWILKDKYMIKVFNRSLFLGLDHPFTFSFVVYLQLWRLTNCCSIH